jgi:hypothetical protein
MFIKKTQFYCIILLGIISVSCGGNNSTSKENIIDENTPNSDTTIYSLSGVLEKGALQQGAEIQAAEWDPIKGYTGNIFIATTSDNKGSYTISSSELTGIVDIKADGFFINENTNTVESSRLVLSGLADSSTKKGNINVITHIIKQRVMKLMTEENKTFAEANTQAITELYNVFNWTINNPLEISVVDNAQLLFFSAVICKDRTVAEVSNILTILTNDFSDGTLDISILNDSIKNINCSQIQANIIAMYGTSPDISTIKSNAISYLDIANNPVITYSYIRNMTIIPTDGLFYYFTTASHSLFKFKNRTLVQINGSYTITTYTYYDEVIQSSLTTTSTAVSYNFTDFYSIGDGVNKILYFTIDGENYKQENSIITKIDTLPIKPVKTKVLYSSSYTELTTSNGESRINRKINGGWLFSLVPEINSYIYGSTDIGNGVIFNVSKANSNGDFSKCGLYVAPDNNIQFSQMIYEVKGEMW